MIHPTEKHFLTFEEVNNAFGYVIDYLYYCSILAAIPQRWKLEVRSNEMNFVLDPPSPLELTPLSKGFSKKVYWLLIDHSFPENDSLRIIWCKELKIEIDPDDWWSLYPNFIAQTFLTKLRFLQYRILMKSLTTNCRCNKWKGDVSPLCTFCETEPETILHLFVYCKNIVILRKKLSAWCKYFLKVNIIFSPQVIIFNNYKGQNVQIINEFIIIMKQHIYSSKCFAKIPNFYGFVNKISYWYNVEKFIMLNRNKKALKKFYSKWKNIF